MALKSFSANKLKVCDVDKTYHNETFLLLVCRGLDNSSEGSSHVKESACHDLVRSYIKGKVDRPDELKHHAKIYAISYYFDRATEFNLIGMPLFCSSFPLMMQ